MSGSAEYEVSVGRTLNLVTGLHGQRHNLIASSLPRLLELTIKIAKQPCVWAQNSSIPWANPRDLWQDIVTAGPEILSSTVLPFCLGRCLYFYPLGSGACKRKAAPPPQTLNFLNPNPPPPPMSHPWVQGVEPRAGAGGSRPPRRIF